jgi:hypothetical protein
MVTLSSLIGERGPNKRKILLASALLAIVLSTIGYAHLTLGTFTVTTKEIATVTVDNLNLGTLPTRSAGSKTFSNAISLAFDKAFAAKTVVTIKMELLISDSNVYKGFRSFVVQVMDASTVKATLTLNSPYDEFTYTIGTAGETKTYSLIVTYATGATLLTDTTFQLSVNLQV